MNDKKTIPNQSVHAGKPTRKRWFMLSLIFILTAINYLDRTNMAVAAPSMSAELGFSAATMGMLLSAFAWAYALMQVPGGCFLERFGPRITYTISLFFWSLFTMIMGLGHSFLSLFGIRMAIGAAESPAFPTNSRVVAAWFPDRERATATSIYTAAEFVGLAFLTPVLFWILDTFGWREIFYITGFVGIGVSVIWYLLYRDPKDCKGVNQAELDYIREGGGQAENAGTSKKITMAQLRELFRHRQLIGIYVSQFANTSTMYFFLTWFPTYLIMAKNLPMLKAGIYAVIPYIGALCGVLLGGRWSDHMLKKGASLSKARKLPIACGLICSMSIMAANYFDSLDVIIAIMAFSFFGQGGHGGYHLEYCWRCRSARFSRTGRRCFQLCWQSGRYCDTHCHWPYRPFDRFFCRSHGFYQCCRRCWCIVPDIYCRRYSSYSVC